MLRSSSIEKAFHVRHNTDAGTEAVPVDGKWYLQLRVSIPKLPAFAGFSRGLSALVPRHSGYLELSVGGWLFVSVGECGWVWVGGCGWTDGQMDVRVHNNVSLSIHTQ